MRYALTLAALLLAPSAALAQHSSRQMRVEEIDPIFQEASAATGVDVRLLRVVAWMESRFKPGAVSPKGARGLMQLMPDTARRFGVADPHDPRQGVMGGAKYLRWLLAYFRGDISLVLAGYNSGEGNVLKYGRRVPPFLETKNYVAAGVRLLALSGAAPIWPPSPPGQKSPAADAPAPAATAQVPAAPPAASSFVRRAKIPLPAPRGAQEGPGTPPAVVSFLRRPPARLP